MTAKALRSSKGPTVGGSRGTGGVDDLMVVQDFGPPSRSGTSASQGSFELHVAVRLKNGIVGVRAIEELLVLLPAGDAKIPAIMSYVFEHGEFKPPKVSQEFKDLMNAVFLVTPQKDSYHAGGIEPHCVPRVRIISEYFDSQCAPRYVFEIRLKIYLDSGEAFPTVQAAFQNRPLADAIDALVCYANPDAGVDPRKLADLLLLMFQV